MLKKFLLPLIVLLTSSAYAQDSSTVHLIKINDHVFIHESYLKTKQWGNVPCNGMVVIDDHEAIIFDTPASIAASEALIHLVADSLHARIKGVVINHFHDDCLAGLPAFHRRSIPSYAALKTIRLADSLHLPVPEHGFRNHLVLTSGSVKTKSYYFGPAHTQDNIVSYIPSQHILFGGCMVKALGAAKGNLDDADTLKWASTVSRVKMLKPLIVIPGHGKYGGPELLDYTIQLFKTDQE